MSQFKEINTESKIRIRLTYLARNTLREDELDFGLGTATLINRIIAHFSSESHASISLRLEQYQRQMEETLGKESGSIIHKLALAEEKRMLDALPVYSDRPESIIFRLSNANLFLLTQDPTTQEERYYRVNVNEKVSHVTMNF